ncbi:hypothetical protein CR513_28208, partial [Mucuna pruriens]
MDKSMIDAASGGALMDKTPAATRHLISNMASNTQQFRIRGRISRRQLENQLTELTSLVRQLAVSQHQPAMAAKSCGIRTFVEHSTDICPTLQEIESDQLENVGAIGGFQYGRQPYQTQPFGNQQYGRKPFRPGPQQGLYAAQRVGSVPNAPQGPAAESTISSTTFPTATTVESAYSRQLSISGRLDEAACNQQPGVPTICELQQYAIPAKHDRHHPGPQDANRTVGKYYEPVTVGWLEQPSLPNHPESEREC